MISFFPKRRAGAEPAIIPPYGPAIGASLYAWRWPLLAAFILFCLVYGYMFALTAPHLIVPFASPLAILFLLSVWALPDLKTAPTRTMSALLLAFTICLFAWPNYLAISLPGLPWITLLRLTGIPMVVLLLVSVSVSKDFRTQLMAILNTTPLVWKFLAVFAVIQLVTIAFSGNIPFSIQKFIVFQTNWTAVFVVSCYAFQKRGRAELYIALLLTVALMVCAIALWENEVRKVLWQGHIPSFLKIEDADTLLAAKVRTGTQIYRAKSTFTTPLGLAEYLALVSPFAIHLMLGRYHLILRIFGGALAVLFFHVIQLTDSRLGIAGLFIGVLTYVLGLSVARWIREKGNLVASAMVFAYPALFCAAVAATFFVGKLKRSIWGGGSAQASNNARQAQIEKGIPVILEQPWGHGPGQGGIALGFYSFNFLTIDNYYLAIAIEYGIIGFIVYYGMLLISIWNSGKFYLAAKDLNDREFDLLLPIMASLSTFFIIKAVFSQQDSHPMIYMLLGMVVALAYRITNIRGVERTKADVLLGLARRPSSRIA